MEQIQGFSSGMQSDSSKFDQIPNSYLEALNFRITTNAGGSNQALVNIEGNTRKVNIQGTFPVYKIEPNTTTGTGVTITINGNTSPSPINIISSTEGFDIYTQLSTITGFGTNFFAAYYQNYAVVWSESFDPIPTFSNTDLILITQQGSNAYVAAQTNIVPIGSTYIRDDIYIFATATPSNPNPGTNVGMIYKLNYDPASTGVIFKLIYINYINFDINHPIPPTATQGRYENDTVERIYWTDDFNKLRSCNVVDPNLMALPSAILDIFPQVQGFIPTLVQLQKNGILGTGVYQYAYRLKKANGQVTLWSELSLPICVYNTVDENGYTNGTSPTGNYGDYVGLNSNINSGKSVTCTIAKVDQTFDFIDICYCYRGAYSDPGTFEIFQSNIPVIPNSPVTFTHYGNETNSLPLTLLEFLLTSPGFTYCKTIETKDNRLFVGNVRNLKQDLSYDSRAYQYPISSTNTTLTNNNVSNTYSQTNLNTIGFLPDIHDAINTDYTFIDPNISGASAPRNETNISGTPSNFQKYYPGSTIPGGQGPNIEFKLGSYAIKVDDDPVADFSTAGQRFPWKHTNQAFLYAPTPYNNINLGIEDENYPMGTTSSPINDSLKTVYKSFLLRGYQPNEIYRFGIQFYDKQGSPYFTKWICDIKMPDYTDDSTIRGKGNNDTSLSFTGLDTAFAPIGIVPGQPSYMQIPYINFTVDVSSIENLISGFEIVRCERPIQDRFIAGVGNLYQCQYDFSATPTNIYVPGTLSLDYSAPLRNVDMYIEVESAGGAGTGGTSRNVNYSFDCGDWNMVTPPSFDTSLDRLTPQAVLFNVAPINEGFIPGTPTARDDGYWWAKYYDFVVNQNSINVKELLPIARGAFIGDNGSISTFSGGWHFNNRCPPDASDGHLHADSNHTVLFDLVGAYSYIKFNSGSDTYKIWAEYRKYGNLNQQYGGRTYINRTNSIYISCGTYIPVDDISIQTTGKITFGCFGGDVFYTVYSKGKGLKVPVNHGSGIESYTHYWPNIGYYNSDNRNNLSFDYIAGANPGIGWNNDSSDINTVYSLENNIKKFFPRPLLFNETEVWDNRVYYSGIKINGETQDSWEAFQANNYWDVEGSYGPINSLIALQDKVYFIQEKGFGLLYIDPMALIPTSNGVPLIVGQGAVIQKHDYISTDTGTKHQWSVSRSPNSILFVDSLNKKVFNFTSNGLQSISDTKLERNVFNNNIRGSIVITDNPILKTGIITTYDYFNDEYLITLLNSGSGDNTLHDLTISYNEKVAAFNSFYSFTPSLYFNNRKQLWSNNPNIFSALYIHNIGSYCTFYNTVYPSTVKLLVNPNTKYSKIYNNFIWNTESIQDNNLADYTTQINNATDTFKQIRIYNDYQNTDFITLDPITTKNIRRVERQWNLQVPRNKVLYTTSPTTNIFTDIGTKLFGERIRDKYAKIDLIYDNAINNRFIVNSFQTKYLISDR